MKHKFYLLMAMAIILTACTGMPTSRPIATPIPSMATPTSPTPTPWPTPVPTRPPTPTPDTAYSTTPTPLPTPAPTKPPTPTPDTICPTSWTVWKVKNPLTGIESYDAPAEVKACVKAQYLEEFRAIAPRTIQEFDPARYNRLLGNPPDSPPPDMVTTVRYTKRVVAVLGFAPDGLSCRVADYTEGGVARTYTWPQKEPVEKKELPDVVVVYSMRYDPATGRWRIHQPEGQEHTALARHELPDGIPELVIQRYGLVEE